MARYKATVKTPKSQQEVFDYLAEFSHTDEWDPGIESSERLDAGELGVGSRFKVVSKFAGREVELEYEVTQYEPPLRVVLRGENSTTISLDEIVVEASGTGSAVTYDADVTLKGATKLFSPALSLMFKRVGDKARDGMAAKLGGQAE